MTGGLPRGARAWLRLLPADLREPIAGDLAEEFHAVRVRRGAIFATLWAWTHAVRLAVAFRWERLRHGRPLPPIAEEVPVRVAPWESLRQDAAFGVRLLRRQPGFATVAVLALALGIGANTAMVSLVDAALWRPLPFPAADAIMSIAEQRPSQGVLHGPVSPADFYDWRRDAGSFSAMAAYLDTATNLTGGDEPMRVRATRVSPAFLRVLSVSPAIGRDFRDEEETLGRNHVTLLSDGLWRRVFGGDPRIVGKTVQLDGAPYQVIGVLPRAFWWRSAPDLLTPLALDDHDRSLRGAHFFTVIGRLRPGVSEAQARKELTAIGQRLSIA
ncbi:MAG TPA: ABC transporter permease, partial [Vicinamibacterales bacterium]|nr:ABC transporter permease [Vicinamibacterales bacterium]